MKSILRLAKLMTINLSGSTSRSCFFFLMIPPPPKSTLFPHTTLFRSGRVRGEVQHILEVLPAGHPVGMGVGKVVDPELHRCNLSRRLPTRQEALLWITARTGP